MSERQVPFTFLHNPSWHPFRDWYRGNLTSPLGCPSSLKTGTNGSWGAPVGRATSAPLASVSPEPGAAGPVVTSPYANPAYNRALSRELSSGISEIRQTSDSWKVALDVNHFAPEELLVKTKDGVVEITDGTLTVEAPLPKPAIQSAEIKIPVTFEAHAQIPPSEAKKPEDATKK